MLEPGGGASSSDLLFYRFGGRPGLARAASRDEVVDEVGSVVAEITLLLNTRSPLCASLSGSVRRTVANYGLSDFLHFSPLNRQDSQRLANLMFDTIAAYEPRLELDSVTVETPRPYRDRVCAVVSGRVWKKDQTLVRVKFPVQVAATPKFVE